MAFVNRPAAVLNYGVRDASGSTSQIQFNVPYATAVAAAFAGADTLRPIVGALTDCAILSQSVTFSAFDDAPAAPVAGSRIEEKGLLVFRTSNGRTSQFSIPAIKDALLTNSGALDRNNVAVQAFVAAVIAADAIWCSADGSDLRSLIKAYQRFRSSTPNMLPSDG